jgi:glycosyltransferase involved in cell wall biosynthesis
MKVLHINAGEEDGGGKTYITSLLSQFNKDEVALAVFNDGPVAKEAREHGVTVHVFNQTSRYDLSILKRVVSFINEEKFDLVHTHGPRANFFVSIIRNKIQAKWALTIHSDPTLDFMQRGIKGWAYTKLNMRTFNRADLLFSVSEMLKGKLLALGVPKEKIRVVNSGIEYDKERSAPIERSEIGVSKEDFVVVHVARLHPVKAHEVLFDAIKKVEKPGVKALIVGDGPIRGDLEAKVKQLDLADNIIFLGHRTDVKRILSAGDVGILTSHNEGLGLVALEAANQHIPFITTDVGDLDKLIINEQNGWIVPVKDSKALAEAMEDAYVKKTEGKLKEMGEMLYERAIQCFSLESLYKETMKYYKEVIK